MTQRFVGYDDFYGDPYYEQELDDQPFPLDVDEDSEYDWHDSLMDELEKRRPIFTHQREEDQRLREEEEDAITEEFDGLQPKFVSMRRAAIMRR